ncbi:hypothetical protein NF865_00280 [Thermococcus aggregans]|uniref:Uncharacterized protein n=1 Tax=Thermococcus aggregans TaxID=110163 RepID=A0A9E7MXP6_THEAG|nr:hypothetical protein [Thermococcus aggregans]USS40714.1 hypothetical protein NF865_00280 [Thermococcus aggregans]
MEELKRDVHILYEKYKEIITDQKKLLNALSELTGKSFEAPSVPLHIDENNELKLRALYASLIYKIHEAWNINRAISMQIMGYNADRKLKGGKTIEKEIKRLVNKYLGIGGRKNEH